MTVTQVEAEKTKKKKGRKSGRNENKLCQLCERPKPGQGRESRDSFCSSRRQGSRGKHRAGIALDEAGATGQMTRKSRRLQAGRTHRETAISPARPPARAPFDLGTPQASNSRRLPTL